MANGRFGGGKGTTKNPFLVEDIDDLQAISRNYNTTLSTLYYKQVKNIDLGGLNWQPINFYGGYDGDNFEITNLTINNVTTTNNNVGLFGLVNGSDDFKGYLINIKLINVNIVTENAWCGGLVGGFEGDFVYNCSVDGRISQSGGGATGGIIGTANPGATILYCTSNVDFSSNDTQSTYYVGGIIGSLNGHLEKCTSTLRLTRQSLVTRIGGLVGSYDGGTIKECEANVNIDTISGNYIGGLIGSTGGSGNSMIISDSFATGSIRGGYYIGGLIGNTSSRTFELNKCYSSVDISASSFAVGGLIGSGGTGRKSINNCVLLSSGITITGSSNSYGDVYGERLSNVSQVTINNVYRLDSFKITKGSNSASPKLNATGTIDSVNVSNFGSLGWDIGGIWKPSNPPVLNKVKPVSPQLPPVPTAIVAKCERILINR